MKLTELNPHWIGTGAIINGVSFLCPHCKTVRLAVLFVESIDPEGWLSKGVTRTHDPKEWNRVGDSFDTLTLSPSIDVSGHWHGYITCGYIA